VPHDVDALNAGLAGQLLEQYLENPSSVPEEWRSLFETADNGELLGLQPGLVRLLERRTNGASTAAAEAPAPAAAASPAEADEERVWLREAIESGRYRQPLTDEEELALLTRLTEVGGLETYLRRAFLEQKQFSIEGLDVLVPMLDEAITLAARGGAHEAVIGM